MFYGIESRRLFDAGLWTPCFVWDSLLCVLVIPSDSRLFGMVFDVELPSYPVQRWCRAVYVYFVVSVTASRATARVDSA